MTDILTPREAGEQVVPVRTGQTVRLWCKDGLSHKKDGKGLITIKLSDFKAFCQKNGIEMKDGKE